MAASRPAPARTKITISGWSSKQMKNGLNEQQVTIMVLVLESGYIIKETPGIRYSRYAREAFANA